MVFVLLSTSCFEKWIDQPKGAAILSATIRQLNESIDGYVVNFSFDDLEDLSLQKEATPFIPSSLRSINEEVAELIWRKSKTCISLPPISDLIPDTEIALAEIINETAERMGSFRFHILVPTIEGVRSLETVLTKLSPFVSLVVSGFETKPSVIDEMVPLLNSTSNLSFAAHGQLWTEQLPAIAAMRMNSLIRENSANYSDLHWSSINSNHRAYLGKGDFKGVLVTGSGRTIPEGIIRHLSSEGSIIVGGKTPIEATPLLFREIENVKEIARAVSSTKSAPLPIKRPTSALEKLAQELRATAV
jgi:hypothetical protein